MSLLNLERAHSNSNLQTIREEGKKINLLNRVSLGRKYIYDKLQTRI